MIVPIFHCSNMDEAIAFYQSVFGCKVLARFQLEQDNSDPAYVTLEFRGDHLHLSSLPGDKSENPIAYVYIDEVDEVDALYETVTAQPGIAIRIPLCDQEWGLREFSFEDPFGNRLRVGAQLQDTLPTTPSR